MNNRLAIEGDVRFVQFPHPGKEHSIGASGVRQWPLGDARHRRTFLQSPASYRTAVDGLDTRGEVAFWGEWESEAKLISELEPTIDGPRFLCSPSPHAESPVDAKGTPPQNTDPFVWGDAIAYIGCRQLRNRKLRRLGRGSLILFGSSLGGRFVLDTVLVVAGWTEHEYDTFDRKLAGLTSDVHMRVGLTPFHGWGVNGTLRYYAGATPRDTVSGMYSFVPCKPAEGARSGFPRPVIEVAGLIEPDARMQARSSEPLEIAAVEALWRQVAAQVLAQGLCLATRLDLPA